MKLLSISSLLLLLISFVCLSESQQYNVLQEGVTISKSLSGGLSVVTEFYLNYTGYNYPEVIVFASNTSRLDISNEGSGYNFRGNVTGSQTFNVNYACQTNPMERSQYYFFVSAYDSATFNITYYLRSSILTPGTNISSNDAITKDVYYQVPITSDCTNLTVLLFAPLKNIEELSFNDQQYCLAKRSINSRQTGGTVCYYDPPSTRDYDVYSSYLLVTLNCSPKANLILRISEIYSDQISPYSISVTSSTAQCSGNCAGHGVCFAGKCYCNEPWSGNNCEIPNPNMATKLNVGFNSVYFPPLTKSFFYTNFTTTDAFNGNLIIEWNANINFKDSTIGFYKQSLDGKTMNQLYILEGDLEDITVICYSGAIGLIFIEYVPQFDTPQNINVTANITFKFVPETIAFGSEIYVPPLSVSSYYRITNIPSYTSLASTMYNQNTTLSSVEFGIITATCTYSNSYDRVERNSISAYSNSDENFRRSYSVEYLPCLAPSTDNQYYIYVKHYMNNNNTKLQVFSKSNCSNCKYGNCLMDGSCMCEDNWSGALCDTPLVPAIPFNQLYRFNASAYEKKIFRYNHLSMNNFFVEFSQKSHATFDMRHMEMNKFTISNENLRCSQYDSNNNNLPGDWMIEFTNIENYSIEFAIQILPLNDPIIVNAGSTKVFNVTMSPSLNGSTTYRVYEINFPPGAYEVTATSINNDFNSYFAERSCENGHNSFTITNGESFYLSNGCKQKRYLTLSASDNLTINVRFNQTETVSCPNCCSAAGICNDNGTCSCYTGFTGSDCSTPICFNNPRVAQKAGIYGTQIALTPFGSKQLSFFTSDVCSPVQGSDFIISYIESEHGYSADEVDCVHSYMRGYYSRYFLPCINGVLQKPCSNQCDDAKYYCACYGYNSYDDLCDSHHDIATNLIENSYFNASNYYCTLSITTGQITSGSGISTSINNPTITSGGAIVISTGSSQDNESDARKYSFNWVILLFGLLFALIGMNNF